MPDITFYSIQVLSRAVYYIHFIFSREATSSLASHFKHLPAGIWLIPRAFHLYALTATVQIAWAMHIKIFKNYTIELTLIGGHVVKNGDMNVFLWLIEDVRNITSYLFQILSYATPQ